MMDKLFLSYLTDITCYQVLELLQETGDEGFDGICLLRMLGQVKSDVTDIRAMSLKTVKKN